MRLRDGLSRRMLVAAATVVSMVALAGPARAQSSLDIQEVSVKRIGSRMMLTVAGVGEYPSDPCGIVELDGVQVADQEVPTSRFRINAKIPLLEPGSIHTVRVRLDDGSAEDTAVFQVPGGGGD
jgi:hypothetical protein